MLFTVMSVLIESRRLLKWVRSKGCRITLYCTQSVLFNGYMYIQRLTAYKLNGRSI